MTTSNSGGGELVQQFLGWLAEPDLEALTDTVLHWLMVLVLAAVAVLVVYFVAREIVLRWYFKGNGAAIAVWKNRHRIEDELDLKLGMMSRAGRGRIAAKQTGSWKRAGVADELANLVHQEITMRFTPGGVTFTTPVKLPERVEGRPTYDAAKGVLTLGVDTETGKPGTIKIKECSGMVVGALPGGGKTVLLEGIEKALKGKSRVTMFDGKVQTAAEMTPELERIQQVMQKRLKAGLKFWTDEHNQKLQVIILDECQVLFEPEGSNKEEKAAAEARKRLVTDLVRRGRSAGILVVLASQRLTADAIPTAIRDICGVRIAGRVTRPEDAELILGRRPGEGELTPVGAEMGQFVVDDGPQWKQLKVFAPS